MYCKNCHQDTATIQQAPDSYFKIVKCYVCFWQCWLKYYNKTEDTNIK